LHAGKSKYLTVYMEKKTSKFIYILLVIMLIVIGVLSYFFIQNRAEHKAVVKEMNIEKEILTEEFQTLALDYDSLNSNNDTLNMMLQQERERIAQLIEEMKIIKATNVQKIREYKKELASLRSVMKSFVVQIDSLNRRNQLLTEENNEHKMRYTQIQSNYKVLEEKKEQLEKKVEIASQLETMNIEVIGLNRKEKDTNRAKNVAKIKVCFTILKNLTASVGEKDVFLRLERPDGSLLIKSLENLFEYEGSEINYSAKRVIEYGSKKLDVCIYYVADEGELMPGKYVVDIFTDGYNIGNGEFYFK